MSNSSGERSLIQKHWQKLLAAAFWAVALSFYGIYIYRAGLSPIQAIRLLANFLGTSQWGPILFLGLYTVRPLFLFSAAVLSIGGGAIFGAAWGIGLTILGSNLGASLAYFIGRFFGGDVLQLEGSSALGPTTKDGRASEHSGLKKYVAGMRENSFETIFFMRLMYLPYDLVNYLAGFLKINFFQFLGATILGSVPGTVSFVLFGASSGLSSGTPEFDPKVMVFSVALFLISLGISRWVRSRETS